MSCCNKYRIIGLFALCLLPIFTSGADDDPDELFRIHRVVSIYPNTTPYDGKLILEVWVNRAAAAKKIGAAPDDDVRLLKHGAKVLGAEFDKAFQIGAQDYCESTSPNLPPPEAWIAICTQIPIPAACERINELSLGVPIGRCTHWKSASFPNMKRGAGVKIGRVCYKMTGHLSHTVLIKATAEGRKPGDVFWEPKFVQFKLTLSDGKVVSGYFFLTFGRENEVSMQVEFGNVRQSDSRKIVGVEIRAPERGEGLLLPLSIEDVNLHSRKKQPVNQKPARLSGWNPVEWQAQDGARIILRSCETRFEQIWSENITNHHCAEFKLAALPGAAMPGFPGIHHPVGSIPSTHGRRIGFGLTMQPSAERSSWHRMFRGTAGWEWAAWTRKPPAPRTTDLTVSLDSRYRGTLAGIVLPPLSYTYWTKTAEARQRLIEASEAKDRARVVEAAKALECLTPDDHWSWGMAGRALAAVGENKPAQAMFLHALKRNWGTKTAQLYAREIERLSLPRKDWKTAILAHYLACTNLEYETKARERIAAIHKMMPPKGAKVSMPTQVTAVRAPGKVTIDGVLDDWNLSKRQMYCDDLSVGKDHFRASVTAMYDDKTLYFAAEVLDETPLNTPMAPLDRQFSQGYGDGIVLMFEKERRPTFLLFFRSALAKENVLHRFTSMTKAQLGSGEMSHSPTTDLGHGIACAYKVREDGTGYTQELAVPWSTVLTGKTPASGSKLRFGFLVTWGSPYHIMLANFRNPPSRLGSLWTRHCRWLILSP